MSDDIKQLIKEFNNNNIVYKISSQVRLLKYNRLLTILLHAVNALSIILSVLSETVQDKIIYVVIVCSILNSVLNYEVLKVHSKLQNNTKTINDFLKQNEIKEELFMPNEMIVGRCKTPMNSQNELISV